MQWKQPLEFASLSDVGFRRANNQDSLAVQLCDSQQEWDRRGHLFVVADGMGGHAAGELASKITTDTLPHTFAKMPDLERLAALKRSVEVANTAVNDRGNSDSSFDQMGTTCSCLVLSPEGAIIGHVGDSRVYRIRDGVIEQLTFDHSLQWELIRSGKLTPEEVYASQPANVITRSLGPDPTVEVDIEGPLPIRANDVYVLCSDGLTGHVADPEIGMIAGSLPTSEACQMLVNLANLRGGTDNISVIVVRVGPGPGTTAQRKVRSGGFSLSWVQFLTLCVLAFGVVASISGALLRRMYSGYVIAGVFAVIGIGLLVKWYRNRPPAPEVVEGHIGDPYRTADAELSAEFVDQTVAIGKELLSHSKNERWPVNGSRLQVAHTDLNKTEKGGTLSQRFFSASRFIQVLMSGLKQHRKTLKQKSTPPAQPKNDDSIL